MRTASFIFFGVVVSLVCTVTYLWWSTRSEHATSLYVIRAYTLYSPLFWLMLSVVWGATWWLCRGWLRAAH